MAFSIAMAGSNSQAVVVSHVATSTDPSYSGASTVFSGCDQVTATGGTTINVITASSIPTIYVYEADTPTAGKSLTYYLYASVLPSTGNDFSVTPTISISGATFSGSSYAFTDGGTNPQTVDVTLPTSVSSQLGYVTCTITHTTSPSNDYQFFPDPFVVTILTTSQTSGVLQSAFPVFNEGAGTYTLTLLSKPASTVTITLSVSPDLIALSSYVYTFDSTSYSTPQTVTMTTRPSTVTLGKMYTTTISHTATSSDDTYNGDIYFSRNQNLPVYIMNNCSSGSYANLPGSGTCTVCPAGYYCPMPYGDKVRCPSGYYSAASALVCTPCPAGSSCADPSVSPGASAVGTYATGTATSCTPCEAGHACPSKIESVPCVLGTYAVLGSGSCVECPAGSYCADTTKATACKPGYASAAGAIRCTKCPPGFSCSAGTLASITNCALGSYSPGGYSTCLTCPSGHRCSLFDDLGVCPEGTYSVKGNCVLCPLGYACTAGIQTLCSPAYSFIGDNACRVCPAGFQCVAGFDPVPCPPGYTNADGTSITCTACASTEYADGSCLTCPAGMYCDGAFPIVTPLLCPLGT